MNWNHLLLSFDGRISRQTFWIGFAALFVAELAAQSVAQGLEGERLGAIVDLAFTYPEFALFAKRAHDRNTPIWLVGVFFVVGAFLSFMTVIGEAGSLDERSLLFKLVLAVWLLLALALLVDLGFRRGVPGRSQHGPDPTDAHP